MFIYMNQFVYFLLSFNAAGAPTYVVDTRLTSNLITMVTLTVGRKGKRICGVTGWPESPKTSPR